MAVYTINFDGLAEGTQLDGAAIPSADRWVVDQPDNNNTVKALFRVVPLASGGSAFFGTSTSGWAWRAYRDAGSANHSLKVKYVGTAYNTSTDTPSWGGWSHTLAFRYIDANNHFGLWYDGTKWYFALRVNGSGTGAQVINTATETGPVTWLMVADGNTLKYYKNPTTADGSGDTPVFTHTLTQAQIDAGLGSATKVAIIASDTGIVLDDIEVATLTSESLTVSEAARRVYQRSTTANGTGSASVLVSGTYAGFTNPTIQYQLEKDDGTVVQAWATLTAGSGGTYSQAVTVPEGPDLYKIRTRINSGSVPTAIMSAAFGVGIIAAFYGQSNTEYMSLTTTGQPAADPKTFEYGGASWGIPSGTGLRTAANGLRSLFNRPVGVYLRAVGATGIDAFKPGGAYWAPGNGTGFADNINEIGGAFEVCFWNQGEADSGATEAAYESDLAELMTGLEGLNTAVGRSASDVTLVINATGINAGTIKHIRKAQWDFAASRSNVIVGSFAFDFEYGGGGTDIHYSALGYAELGRRYARSYYYHRSGLGHDGAGPVITGAMRSGAVVTVSVDKRGHNSLSTRAGGAVDLAAWVAKANGSPVTISSVVANANDITLTLAANPGAAAVTVEHLSADDYDHQINLVSGDLEAITGSGNKVPLQPTFTAVSASTAAQLVISDASHQHAADSLTLTPHAVLTISDAFSAHVADSILLSVAGSLSIADSFIAHVADSITLTPHAPGSVSLVIADAYHAHAADSLTLTVTPVTEVTYPVSVAEAKMHARIDGSDEDTLVASLIGTAREFVENYTGQVLASEEVVFSFDDFGRTLLLTRGPVNSSVVTYIDTNGDEQTVDAADLRVYEKNGLTRIEPKYGRSWPSTAPVDGAVTVTAQCGYASNSVVPEPLKHAVLITVADLYENRSGGELSETAKNLAAPYRLSFV